MKTSSDITEQIGSSKIARKLDSLISRAAKSSSSVLIEGETGTGKELIAKQIHSRSSRSDKPLITVNCSALPENLLEAELFGYQKGAFTGAQSNRKGLFESAEGGTIFLDEIGDMPVCLQPKLLRVLQEKVITPLGTSIQRRIDFRVVCATNHDLRLRIREKLFREDLLHRLNVISIRTSPLRQRREDIPELIEHFSNLFSYQSEKKVKIFDSSAIGFLLSLPYTGNIRELENIIERLYALCDCDVVTEEDIKEIYYSGTTDESSGSYDFSVFCQNQNLPTIDELYDGYLQFVWQRCKCSTGKTASILGVSQKTIQRKLKQVPSKFTAEIETNK